MDGFACYVISEAYDADPRTLSSRLAVEAVLTQFTNNPTLSAKKLRSYIKEANRQLKQQSSRYKLKASLMIVATDYKKLRYAHVGNCRLIVFRGNIILHKSQDQSLHQHLVAQGQVPDNDTLGYEERRNLLNYLGKDGSFRVDVSKKITLEDEDILLMSTWGFWENVGHIEALDALEEYEEPQGYLETLQDLLLSKQDGEIHNYTVAGVFANKTYVEKDNRKKIIKLALLIGIPMLLLIIGLSVWWYISSVNRTELINTIQNSQDRGEQLLSENNHMRALSEFEQAIDDSRELGGIRRRLRNQNAAIQEGLEIRQRLTRLIIDGDSQFRAGSYEYARENFERVLEEIIFLPDLYDLINQPALENRIALTRDHRHTLDLMSLANFQADLGQLTQALDTYGEARRIAETNRNTDAISEIRLNVDRLHARIQADEAAEREAQDRLTQEEVAQRSAEEQERVAAEEQALADRIQAIELQELQGDMAVRAGDLDHALLIYAQVQQNFIEIGEVMRAADIEFKLFDVTNRIRQQSEDEQASVASSLMQSGDLLMLENDFTGALDSFNRARDLFSILGRQDDMVILATRIDIATTRQAEVDLANRLFAIQEITDAGHELLAAEQFFNALEQFRLAQMMYRVMNQMDRALEMQEMVRDLESMMRDMGLSTISRRTMTGPNH